MCKQTKVFGVRCLSLLVCLALTMGLLPAAAAAPESRPAAGEPVTVARANTDYAISPDSAVIQVGATKQLTVTNLPKGATVAWSSDKTDVADVSSKSGQVTNVRGVSAGSATISAKITGEGNKWTVTRTCKITVNKPTATISGNLTLAIGESGTITVSNIPAEASSIAWSTTSNAISVSSNNTISGGKSTCTVKGVSATSKVNVTATIKYKNGGSDTVLTCGVTVTNPSITLSSGNLTLGVNQNTTVKATTVPSNKASDVLWTSSNTKIVGVGKSNGQSYTGASCVLYGNATGSATVTASFKLDGKEYKQSITVDVENIAGTIRYTTNGDELVHLVAADFNKACRALNLKALDYIIFDSLSTSYGTLYYDYSTNTERGTAVNTSRRYSYSGSYPISDLTFVPKASSSGTAVFTYTGYSSDSPAAVFTGTIEIVVGSSSGDLTYTIERNGTLSLSETDFNRFCRNATGSELDYVRFTSLPTKSQGALYFKYNTRNGDYDHEVTTGSQERYYYRGTDALSEVTFVPGDNYTGTVTIKFTAYSVSTGSNSTVNGTLTVTVGKGNAADITYETEKNEPVTLDVQDFNDYCKDITGRSYNLDYVTFTLPSSSRGVLYSAYSSTASSSKNTRLTSSTRCYRSTRTGVYLEDVTFVPANNYTGSVSIPFTGYDTDGNKFSGTMRIYVGSGVGDITYSAELGKSVTFKLSDFTDYSRSETNSNLNYVTFDLPAASVGTLYYTTSGSNSREVRDSTRFYRNQSPQVDAVTFEPARNLTGTVKIPFDGVASNGDSFSGTVVITYKDAIKEASVIRYTTTGTPVRLQLRDFTSACDARGGTTLSYVKFAIPDNNYGKLYNSYSSAAVNGGQINVNLSYNVTGSPALGDVVFLPKAGFSGIAVLRYTGTDKDGLSYAGTVEIAVTAPVVSAYFTDVGSNYSWAAASVDYLYQAGVVNGTDATHTRYAPAQNITRGDFVLMLYRAFGLQAAGTASFTDVPQNSYYAGAIASAKALGIATGGGDGTFAPGSPLTRQDAMLLIQRTLNATGYTMRDGNAAVLSGFSDRANVAGYAQGAVAALVQAGIIKGDQNGRLNAASPLTRAEMATILHRVLTM